jgi:hypothetical protein
VRAIAAHPSRQARVLRARRALDRREIARNLSDTRGDRDNPVRFLVHDRDKRFGPTFDEVFRRPLDLTNETSRGREKPAEWPEIGLESRKGTSSF